MACVQAVFEELVTEVTSEVGDGYAHFLLDEARDLLRRGEREAFLQKIDQLEAELSDGDVPGTSLCIAIINHPDFDTVAA